MIIRHARELQVAVREKLIDSVQQEYPQALPKPRVELREPVQSAD